MALTMLKTTKTNLKITCLLLLFSAIIASGFILTTFKTDKLMNIFIMLGPPGSGKGTQAARASKELGLQHISTGDLFRENLKNDTNLGKQAREYMDAGRLVPDELVLAMLFERISREDCTKGCFLDGFPRTIPQAEALQKHMKADAHVVVLNLKCSDESVVKRISGRETCKGCGAVYNKYFSPSKIPNCCDKCSSTLIQRIDDQENIVQERLKVYKNQTEPLIDFYKKQQILVDISGENNPDIVFNDLIKATM
jgi:adenylate kinase